MSEPVVCFAGRVACARSTGALRLTLSGTSAAPQSQAVTVAFTAAAPAGLPAVLEDAVVEASAAGVFRIASPAGEWTVQAATAHVHRDVTAAFYAAIPPRPVPLAKRLFWRLVLALAGSNTGVALLRRLRGSS
jgi:hypothetical protein